MAHPGNVIVHGVAIPFNIVNIVCRTHPGIAFSIFSLYFGDKGTYILGKNSSTSDSGHTLITVVRSMLAERNISPTIYALLPPSHRTAARLLGTINLISLVVPQNDDSLVGCIHSRTHMPIVRAKTNVYRACFSGSKSGRGKHRVIGGTGAHHIDIYGTLSYLVIRHSQLNSLPCLYKGLSNDGIVVCTSRPTFTTLSKRCPATLLRPTATSDFNARFLSCGVTVHAISSLSRTLRRVTHCDSGRDRDVIDRSARTVHHFRRVISTTYICTGMSATFASKTRFNFKTRVNVDARGLRTHNPVTLPRLAACGCVVRKSKRVQG